MLLERAKFETAVFIDAEAGSAILGDADAAGVEERDAGLRSALLVDLHMRVAVDERVAGCEPWGIVDAVVKAWPVDMTVGEEQHAPGFGVKELVVRRHARKVEHHLVHFGFAVASHGDDARGECVEHLDDVLGRIVSWQVVAWSVVKKVAE